MENIRVAEIKRSENPNAVCAIHALRSRNKPTLVTATHEVFRNHGRYFACSFHAERAALSARINKAAVALGRKGGKAGTGASKRRGDSAYYRALRAKGK